MVSSLESRMPVFDDDARASTAGFSMPLAPIKAGFQSPSGDPLDSEIDPIAWIVRHQESTFWWRVEGDCLWDVGIRDGDVIAVDRAGKHRLGRAVLAVVDGAITAKILRKRDGKLYLAAANSREAFPDIELTEGSKIWGVIAGVVRRDELA
jgi:DNA polymerase V